jgi:transcriptional regulator with XRE-family HTH domain
MHCGKALMLLRKFKNKSQQWLAEKLTTTQQYIYELEKMEHINGEKLDAILKALNCSRDEWEHFKKGLPPPPV